MAQTPSLYARRLQREYALSDAEIESRVSWRLPVLSENQKCGISLDLPVSNCQPTAMCREVCYACQGRQLFRKALIKTLAVSRMIERDPQRVAQKMVNEAEGRIIRVAGSGELLPEHKTLLDYVESLDGSYWGFTRRIDTHRMIPGLMFSFDQSTPAFVMDYVRNEVPVDRRAYMRKPNDPVASLEVAVTFPIHGPVTPYAKDVPDHSTDCPADRHEVAGCWSCKRCY